MLGDMVPIVREFPDREDIRIYPVYDLHIGAAEFMESEWAAYRKQILADDNGYAVLGGDLINNGIKSSVTNVYDEVMRPREQKQRLIEELEPMAKLGKIICGISGNHERRSAREVDNDILYDVFAKLDIESLYRQNACFTIVRIGDKHNNGETNPTYRMACLHGAGGGMYIGSGANRQERFGAIIDGLDLLITGHTHKPLSFPVSKLVFDAQNNRISFKDFRVVTATSWLGYGGYPVQKMMTPTAHVEQTITLSGKRKNITVTA